MCLLQKDLARGMLRRFTTDETATKIPLFKEGAVDAEDVEEDLVALEA